MIAALVAGCTSPESTGGDPTDTGSDVLDVRVAVPPQEAGLIDYVSPELEIPSGEERMFCAHLEATEELAVTNLKAFQGKYGHHIVLLTAKKPQPVGTVEDCTDRATMANYGPFVLPDTPLDDGYGVHIEKGAKLVMQMHYVNASDKTLLIRDVARIQFVPKETVKTWVNMLGEGPIFFSLPPQQKSEVSFDCDVPANTRVLVFGGHMHERGTKFEALLGKDEASLKSLYLVDPWVSEFRDAPPISLFFDNNLVVPERSILRQTCSFNNEAPKEVTFPEEMCANFGYYIPPPGETITCKVDHQ